LSEREKNCVLRTKLGALFIALRVLVVITTLLGNLSDREIFSPDLDSYLTL